MVFRHQCGAAPIRCSPGVATLLLAASICSYAQKAPPAVEQTATIRSLRVLPASRGTQVEIDADRVMKPAIQQLEKPPRLVIDLPNTQYVSPRKRFSARSDQVSAVRIDQFQKTPPVTRVVVDLLQPVDYRVSGKAGRLVIALEPSPTSQAPAISSPSTFSISQGVEPAIIPVIPGASGAVFLAGRRIAAGASVTAGADTALLRLGRGGQVKVCPGTSVTVTPSKNGQDLMLAMGTGAVETHYRLGASADSILTPDFRILLAGPGEFHYAISADPRGNTCVRSLPGNTASVIVTELMDAGTYQIKPREQIIFRSGHLNLMDIPHYEDCGCPAPTVPVLRTSAPSEARPEQEMPESAKLARPTDSPARQNPPAQAQAVAPVSPPTQLQSTFVPEAKPNQIQVRIEAPIVYRTRSETAAPPRLDSQELPLAYRAMPAATLNTALPPEENKSEKPAHRGVMGKIGGFFSNIFR